MNTILTLKDVRRHAPAAFTSAPCGRSHGTLWHVTTAEVLERLQGDAGRSRLRARGAPSVNTRSTRYGSDTPDSRLPANTGSTCDREFERWDERPAVFRRDRPVHLPEWIPGRRPGGGRRRGAPGQVQGPGNRIGRRIAGGLPRWPAWSSSGRPSGGLGSGCACSPGRGLRPAVAGSGAEGRRGGSADCAAARGPGREPLADAYNRVQEAMTSGGFKVRLRRRAPRGGSSGARRLHPVRRRAQPELWNLAERFANSVWGWIEDPANGGRRPPYLRP